MNIEDLYFSIIIPAHNEEKYIVSTLEHIKKLDYPKEKLEVFVIENGSTDKTRNLSKSFEDSSINIFSIQNKGVSIAKNYGINKITENSKWTIILDADTLLESSFLKDLNYFILKNKSKNIVIGTTKVLPIPESFKAKLWFNFYDFGHQFLKASYSIQIIKSPLLKEFHFNEDLAMGEDLALIDWARKKGKFFFFKTDEVKTSTRRFDKEGYWSVLFSWTISAVLIKHFKKMFSYRVVR